MFYEFTKAITADTRDGKSRTFAGGDRIEKVDVIDGCFDALIRQGILVPVPMQAAEPSAVVAQAVETPAEAPAEPQRHTHGKGRR